MSQIAYHECKFNGEILNTAYSTIGLGPINTAEHFRLAAHLGFNTLKGDVRITSDGGLIMCHDAGFTLDENGRITKYDKDNSIAMIDHTYEYLMSLEYDNCHVQTGHYAKVCNFDTYIRICKENGKIAFVTIRENDIPNLVPAVLKVLGKYHMESRCVINSFTLAALQEVRKYTDSIPLSLVLPLAKVLNKNTVDVMIPLKPSIISMFLYPGKEPLKLWDESSEALDYAQEFGIQIHMAQVGKYSDYCDMITRGVQGVQITRPYMPYTKTNIQFKITVDENGAQFGNIIGSDRLIADIEFSDGVVQIRNIKCSGSGYGYDDGLPALWLNTLPYSLHATRSDGVSCPMVYRDNTLFLTTGGVCDTYYIDVNI